MIEWLMQLIRDSLKSKIHHFSLDFGSALLANIIHAPTTLASLSEDPKLAQHVQIIINLVNGINVETFEIKKYSSINIDALANLSILLV